MSILSHLSLTMVPLVIGVMFSQTEVLREAWKKNTKVISSNVLGESSSVITCHEYGDGNYEH
jgi:hypothetical protein